MKYNSNNNFPGNDTKFRQIREDLKLDIILKIRDKLNKKCQDKYETRVKNKGDARLK